MDPSWRFGVDDRYYDAPQEAERDESLFAVVETIVWYVKNTSRASTKSKPWSFRFDSRFASCQVNRICEVNIQHAYASSEGLGGMGTCPCG